MKMRQHRPRPPEGIAFLFWLYWGFFFDFVVFLVLTGRLADSADPSIHGQSLLRGTDHGWMDSEYACQPTQ